MDSMEVAVLVVIATLRCHPSSQPVAFEPNKLIHVRSLRLFRRCEILDAGAAALEGGQRNRHSGELRDDGDSLFLWP